MPRQRQTAPESTVLRVVIAPDDGEKYLCKKDLVRWLRHYQADLLSGGVFVQSAETINLICEALLNSEESNEEAYNSAT